MDALLNLAQPWAYVLIATIAAAESAAFIGLVLPGEATMLLAGVLVYQGRASLPLMLVVGCAGAIAGDSGGYAIGRFLGPRLMRGRLGRRVGPDRWERAHAYLRARGARAVLIGRFIGVLRALMPAIAGSAGVPYRSFVLYSVTGAVVWVTAFILLGVAAGGSWHVVERFAGQASLILAGLLVVGVGLTVVARWLQGHLEVLRGWRAAVLRRPAVTRFVTRRQPQIDWLARRLDPTERFGLYLTLGFVLAIAGAVLFGELLDNVLDNEDAVVIDRPVSNWVVLHREPVLNTVMVVITALGGAPFVSFVFGVAALIVYRRTGQRRWVIFLATTVVGALVLDDVVKRLVDRPRPDLRPLVEAAGSSFPSGHATTAAATCAAMAYLLTRHRSWRPSVTIWTVAAGLAGLIAFSRVYLGVHWPTDILGGLALGGFWTAVTATAVKVMTPTEAPKHREARFPGSPVQ
ncbi:MAG: bifunctional DedA family/phosphatase PAP2 family protein [Actinomycetota bacterium]|nr:bifunctional DedA family/phosphatase PAP2 family protein [Actinomycetota bacterium]